MSREKKSIAISVACYNEIENIEDMADALVRLVETELADYDCNITFIDNHSNDGTQEKLMEICRREKRVRAIFNAKNFGGESGYYGLLQTDADCSVAMPCDFQIPLSVIPQAVRKWEEGKKIVAFVKGNTEEKGIKRQLRRLYYFLIVKFSAVEQIPHFTGAGLYDRSFLDVCRKINDPIPSMRGNVAEFGFGVELLPYDEKLRARGKSKNSFYDLVDLAIRNFISYTSVIPRFSTILGIVLSLLSFGIGIFYFIQKLLHWNNFAAGITPVLIGLFFIGGVQLLFMGLIGEYLIQINTRIKNHPLVIEEKRLNFDKKKIQSVEKAQAS